MNVQERKRELSKEIGFLNWIEEQRRVRKIIEEEIHNSLLNKENVVDNLNITWNLDKGAKCKDSISWDIPFIPEYWNVKDLAYHISCRCF